MKKPTVVIVAAILVALLVLGFAGCGSITTGTTTGTGGLQKFSSQQAFIDAFKRGSRSYGMMEDGAMMKSAQPSNQLSTGSAESQAPDHSSTNVQVQGVDEADFIKNDGNFIYTISKDDIVIMSAYPPESAKVVARIPGENGVSFEAMFVDGDRLMAIGQGVNNVPHVGEEQTSTPAGPVTIVEVFDVKDRANPRLVRTVAYEGDYSTARLVNGDAYIVLTTYPYRVMYDKKDIVPSDIIPRFSDTNEGGAAGLAPACGYQAVEAIDERGFSSFLSILSLSMRDDASSINKRVIAGYSESVYASAGNIYVASTDYQQPDMWEGAPGSTDTTIFKFKLDGASTKYAGSAKVPGTVLNQFSMDESGGYFRIATTRGYVSRETATSTNNVYVLDPALKVTGKLEGLAPGEKIYSARFMGTKAYLVTFKKVDPFFVLDMSDPANPRVLGALKIPGFSDYLHPYDETHVIGVGKNTVEGDPAEGNFAWYQGMKIAMFDVTDVANPKEMFKVEIGDRGTDSYALDDHMAFLFDREKNLLVIPVLLAQLTPEQKASPTAQPNDYGQYTYQGAFVYDISLAGGIKEKGRITHMGAQEKLEQGYSYYDADTAVRRSLYIGDDLYTVSDGHIKINRLGDLAEVANVSLSK
jgi:inhibitor of cysteine peptidase